MSSFKMASTRMSVFVRMVAVLALLLTAVATVAGGVTAQESDPALTTYTDPNYGFSVTYDPGIWGAQSNSSMVGETGDLPLNSLYLFDGQGTNITFWGTPAYHGDAADCAEASSRKAASFFDGDSQAVQDAEAQISTSTANGGVVRTISSSALGKNAYIECHTIVAGVSVVEVWCYAEQNNKKCFDDQTLQPAQVVIATLTLPVTEKSVSQTYGYSFAYLPVIWTPYQQQSPTEQDGEEAIRFHHAGRGEATILNVSALPDYGGDAATCLNDESAKSLSGSSFTNVKPKLNDKRREVRGTSEAGGEFAAFTFERDGVASIGYIECRTIEAGTSVLRISMVANAETYDEDFADARMVFDSIAIDPGLKLSTPTP